MSNPQNNIEGRVASILNARELIINVGSENNVKPHMKFAVLAETPLVVKDPVTGEELDQVDREKVRVEVTEVRPKISICRTYRIRRIPGGPLYAATVSIWQDVALTKPPKDVPETLRVDDASVPPPLPEEESYVKVKDRVLQVLDD